MFSRAGAYEASIAFHQLAQLRPELVIPPILERLYSALVKSSIKIIIYPTVNHNYNLGYGY